MLYLTRDGHQVGPFSETEVLAKVIAHEISLTDLAWREGEPEWKPLSNYLQLSSNRSSTPLPPPIPTSDDAALPPEEDVALISSVLDGCRSELQLIPSTTVWPDNLTDAAKARLEKWVPQQHRSDEVILYHEAAGSQKGAFLVTPSHVISKLKWSKPLAFPLAAVESVQFRAFVLAGFSSAILINNDLVLPFSPGKNTAARQMAATSLINFLTELAKLRRERRKNSPEQDVLPTKEACRQYSVKFTRGIFFFWGAIILAAVFFSVPDHRPKHAARIEGKTAYVSHTIDEFESVERASTRIGEVVYNVATSYPDVEQVVVRCELRVTGGLIDKYGKAVSPPYVMGEVRVGDLGEVRKYVKSYTYAKQASPYVALQLARMPYGHLLK